MTLKRIFILVILFHGFNFLGFTQSNRFSYEEVVYNENIRFPYIKANAKEDSSLVSVINEHLQYLLFYERGLNFHKDNTDSLNKYMYFYNDADSTWNAGIDYLDYSIEFFERYLRISTQTSWSGGAYPVSGDDVYQFDLHTGNLIQFPDLIQGNLFFQFLDSIWLPLCQPSIKEAHQCGHGNETDDYDNDQFYILDGPCEFQCHKINNRFILNEKVVNLQNNDGCYAHYGQNCNYGCNSELKVSEWTKYLSGYGKWLLGLSNEYQPIEPYMHLVGKINEKKKISITLYQHTDSLSYNGYYFCWDDNKSIDLIGQYNLDHQQLTLFAKSKTPNDLTFLWYWDNHSTWISHYSYYQKDSKQLPLEIRFVYNYKDREHYR